MAQIYPEHTSKLAHVLVQLLQAEYPIELDNIKYTLIQLMQIDIKGCVLEVGLPYNVTRSVRKPI